MAFCFYFFWVKLLVCTLPLKWAEMALLCILPGKVYLDSLKTIVKRVTELEISMKILIRFSTDEAMKEHLGGWPMIIHFQHLKS